METNDRARDEVYWLLKFSSDRASMLVEFSSDMDDDAKRDAINSAAAELQAFYPPSLKTLTQATMFVG